MSRILALFALCLTSTLACSADPNTDTDELRETGAELVFTYGASDDGASKDTVGDFTYGKTDAAKCSCDDVGNPQPGEVCDRCEVINNACWCFYHLKTPTSGRD